MQKIILKNGLTLGIFALLCAAAVSWLALETKDTIALQKKLAMEKTLQQVIPQERYDNDIIQSCVEVNAPSYLGSTQNQHVFIAKKNNKPVGLAIKTTAPDGYNGNIHLMIGVDSNLRILGVRTLEHQETPGLGNFIELSLSSWVLSFNGLTFDTTQAKQWNVKKDGGQFDQFTGATITPRAYVKAVKNTLIYLQKNYQNIITSTKTCDLNL